LAFCGIKRLGNLSGVRIAASVLRKPQGFTPHRKNRVLDAQFVLIKNLTLVPHRQ
jgi:hypothetical protein